GFFEPFRIYTTQLSIPRLGLGRRRSKGLALTDPGLAKLSRRHLRTRLVDEDAADPVGVLGLGDDFDVPVVVVTDRGPVPLQDPRAEVGGGVKHHLVAGVSESARERAEVVGEESRQITEVL